MNKETDLSPVVPGLFSLPPYDKKPPSLLGAFCPDCNRYYFPRPKYCPRCLAPASQIPLKSNGTIYSYTVVRIKPPFGLPSPYSVIYVDLTEVDLRVFGLFDPEAIDRLRIGLDVELAAGPLGINSQGQSCLRPYFKLRKQMKDRE
ncbi:MAG: OB-fold domain-containing protein [Proteobacteria bacterium]|nr:OB-fold domain-containing protein [Pseudomonadota bacterium]MBU1695557.1 OB-fold domain-containing protein [Pseudomonadota bacterium]